MQKNNTIQLTILLAKVLGFLIIVQIVGSAAFDVAMKNSSFRIPRISEGTISVDALIAGNSRAVNLIEGNENRKVFSTFNLGYNGLAPQATTHLIKDYFESGNRAKVVIIEATTLYVQAESCGLKTFSKFLDNVALYLNEACRQEMITGTYLSLTLYNTQLFLRSLYYLFGGPKKDQNWLNDYGIGQSQCQNYVGADTIRFSIEIVEFEHGKSRETLDELQRWLDLNDYKTQIILVLAPMIRNENTELFVNRAANRIASDLRGTEYLDLSDTIKDACSQFADGIHVNRTGVKALFPKLTHELDSIANS
jgi:hypothetical protein